MAKKDFFWWFKKKKFVANVLKLTKIIRACEVNFYSKFVLNRFFTTTTKYEQIQKFIQNLQCKKINFREKFP